MAKKRNLGSLFSFLEIDDSKFNTGLENAIKNLRKAGKNMQKVGQELSRNVTLPIAAIGAVSIKSAIDFESAFTGVKKTVNASASEFRQLEKDILAMSKRMPASAVEIAGVAEAAGQLGIETKNITSFTETMIALGETTNLSADMAATSLARFANITGLSQSDFDRLGSSIVALGNNFATTESEIVEMGMRLAGAGKQANLSEGDILGLATALTSVGVNAEAGGSAFSRVIKEIQVAVERGGSDLANFAEIANMSGQEFANAFRESPSEAIETFVSGFARIKEEGGSAIQALDKVGLSSIRVSDALLRSANAQGLLKDAFELGNRAFQENSALAAEVALRYQTTASQLEIAKNNLTAIAITIGGDLLPLVREFAEYTRELSIGFSELDPNMRRTAIGVAAVAAAIGPVTLFSGKLLTLFASINPWILAINVGLAAGAVVWAKYGDEIVFMAERLRTEWPRLVQDYYRGLDEIQNRFQIAIGDFNRGVETIISFFANLPTAAIEKSKEMVEGVKTWLVDRFQEKVVAPVQEKIEAVVGWFRWMDNEVVRNSYVPDMVESVIAEFKILEEGMTKKSEMGTRSVVSDFELLGKSVTGNVKKTIEAVEKLRSEFQAIGKDLETTKLEIERNGLDEVFERALQKANSIDFEPLKERLAENVRAGVEIGLQGAFEAADRAEALGQAELANQLRDQATELVDYKTRLELDAINGRILEAQKRATEESFNFWVKTFENAITGESFDFEDMGKRFGVGFAAQMASTFSEYLGFDFSGTGDLQGLGGEFAKLIVGNIGDIFGLTSASSGSGGFGYQDAFEYASGLYDLYAGYTALGGTGTAVAAGSTGASTSIGAAYGTTAGTQAATTGTTAATLGSTASLAGVAGVAALYGYQAYNSYDKYKSGDATDKLEAEIEAALLASFIGAWLAPFVAPINDVLGIRVGKGKEQLDRDQGRLLLQDLGLIDDNYMLSLFGGGQFDIGKEEINGGDQKIYNLNGNEQYAGFGNLLSDLVGGGDNDQFGLAAMFTNALASAENFNVALVTTQGLMAKLGVDTDQAKTLMLQAFNDGKITLEELNANFGTLNQLAVNHLGSMEEAFVLLADVINGPPADAIRGIEIAFNTAKESGVQDMQALIAMVQERFGPETAAVFQEVNAAGIDLFTDFSTLSQDQILLLFNQIELLKPLIGELAGETETTSERMSRSFDGVKGSIGGAIEKVNELIEKLKEVEGAGSGDSSGSSGGSSSGSSAGSSNDGIDISHLMRNVPVNTVPVSPSNNSGVQINVDARGADAGVELRVVNAMQRMRDQLVRDFSR